MFENFCIAQSLRSLITRDQLPATLSQFVDVFQNTFCDSRSRGTLISDSKAFKIKFSIKPDAASDAAPSRHLSASMRSAIQKWNVDREGSPLEVTHSKLCSPVAKAHYSLEKDGIMYKPRTAPHPSNKELPHPSGRLSGFNTPNDHSDFDRNDQNLQSSVNMAHCFIAFHHDTTPSWSAGRI